jgi:DNA polymerase-3 subunit beta
MQFRIKKDIVLQALTKIQGITGKKTNIAITSNVLVSASETKVTLTATDLEIAFQGTYEADVSKEGSCAIPSRKFFEIVKDFPSDVIAVTEQDNKWVRIADDKVEYDIVGMESEEFPGLPDVEGVALFDMDGALLKNMIEKTMYAVFSDEGRAHLAGVYFEKVTEGDQEILRMVSTDGHRLSKVDQPLEKENTFVLEKGVIIPKTGVAEILKVLDSTGGVQIGIKDKNFILKKDPEVLIIRLIEGDFPDYTLVIPKTSSGELRIKKDIFLMMLKRMSIFSSDKYRSVHFNIDKQEMETKTTNPEIGESREIIPVEYNGEKVEIAFNPRYFIDAVGSMSSSEVVIRVNDEATPCILEGKDDPNFLSVIMPMRI